MVSMVLRHRLAGVRNLRYSHVGPLVQESRRMDAGRAQERRRISAEKMPEGHRMNAGKFLTRDGADLQTCKDSVTV